MSMERPAVLWDGAQHPGCNIEVLSSIFGHDSCFTPNAALFFLICTASTVALLAFALLKYLKANRN